MEPCELPPCQVHDHWITLQDGASIVNIRPYWYSIDQKIVIKQMTKEKVEVGIIQPSHSLYLSKRKKGPSKCVLTTHA